MTSITNSVCSFEAASNPHYTPNCVGVKKYRQLGDLEALLGCTIENLKAHIEAQFTDGMTWDTCAHRGWHLDHIQPLSSFDLTNEAQLKQAMHYTNLQPLWAGDNLRKHAKIESSPRKKVSKPRS